MGSRGGLKHKSNKLHSFVFGDGADDDFQTALMRQDGAEVLENGGLAEEATKPSRQEIADDVRIAMPKPRHPTGHLRDRSLVGQHHSRSPVRSRNASPRPAPSYTDTTEQFNSRFAGSQLGDDFMRSEASTPHPQLDEVDENTALTRRRDHISNKQPPRWSSSRPEPLEEKPQFVTTDDGFMAVVKDPKKHTPTALRDGFSRDVYYHGEEANRYDDDRALPHATGEHQRLPIRTEPRRLTKAKEDRVMYSTRAASPAYQPDQWAPKRHHELRRSPQRVLEPVQLPLSEPSDDGVRVTAKAGKLASVVYGATVEAEEPTQFTVRGGSGLRKRHRDHPDYDDQVLSSMSYKDLRDEAFDYDPSKAALAVVTNDGNVDLPTKLEQRRHRNEEEQCQFFASMPMNEWEESGDWFVDQFATLMKKMKDARREKRQAIQEFEEEAEKREEVVRMRTEAIDRKLGKMRQDGAKVVGDDLS